MRRGVESVSQTRILVPVVSFSLRHIIYLASLALGIYAQLAQALLIRESLVVFYGNEISLDAFFGSWLFCAAAGSASVIRLRQRPWIRSSLRLFRWFFLVLPPTPRDSFEHARAESLDAGLQYVYIGNLFGHKAGSPYCPRDGTLLIESIGNTVVGDQLTKDGRCRVCSVHIPGVW